MNNAGIERKSGGKRVMSTSKIQLYTQIMKLGFDRTVSDANSVSTDKRLYQLKPGKAHPLWLVGHLANTINTVCLNWTLGKELVLPREWGRTFAPDFAKGDPIVADASKYPAWDDVLAEYKKVTERALAAINELNDADLPSAARGPMPDPFKGFFSSIEATINIMIQHDAHHRGQMMLLSKL
jgi:hypothetical protein